MEAKKLQTGNRIIFNNKEYDVAAIDHNSITVYGDDNVGRCVPFTAVEFIPLTKEILLKFAFNITNESKHHIDWKFKGIKIRYKKETEKYVVGIWTDEDDDCQVIWLDYVHQLQNFFALMNKEIIVFP